ncbi:MAG TPA: cupin domain-containing protein [Edaphobacter sp.]|jgi:quercetin dioxygenase-like cupin family protein|nr:cupin domain-containing protein [Edaphobacter sp.]
MHKSEKFDVLGVELEWKLTDAETNNQYCVLEATIPPGVMVPPHRHPDQEAFLVLEGAPEFALESTSGLEWGFSVPGEMVNVPPMTLHGFRNPTTSDARVLITCTVNLGRFFCEAGLPFESESPYRSKIPGSQQIQRVVDISERYGHTYPSRKHDTKRYPAAFAIEKLLGHSALSTVNRAYLF